MPVADAQVSCGLLHARPSLSFFDYAVTCHSFKVCAVVTDMNSKLLNISHWIFKALAVIAAAIHFPESKALLPVIVSDMTHRLT